MTSCAFFPKNINMINAGSIAASGTVSGIWRYFSIYICVIKNNTATPKAARAIFNCLLSTIASFGFIWSSSNFDTSSFGTSFFLLTI